MELWLIRHTAVDLPAGICYGQSDVPLRASFAREAAEVARRLDGVRFDEVWCSPLSRCVRLAEACGYPDARRDPRLMELDFGSWELRRFDEIRDPQLQRWYDDYLHTPATGGESFDDQRRRVAAFLTELSRRTGLRRVALFVHGGTILCARIFAGQLSPEEAFSSITPHGGIERIAL